MQKNISLKAYWNNLGKPIASGFPKYPITPLYFCALLLLASPLNPNQSLDFKSRLCYFEQVATACVEGIADYAETQIKARCRKKRSQELKRSNNVIIIFLFRYNDQLGFKAFTISAIAHVPLLWWQSLSLSQL